MISVGRLDHGASSLSEISAVYEDEQDDKRRPAGLHRFKELLAGSGLFVCFSSVKSNAALTVSLTVSIREPIPGRFNSTNEF
ncbi:hypothetical protein L6452_38665 [Arctium lappa]|uniref:Uncharacterized protein n=1 Tax=Arctium lappa TaxID=4217 RepID=A0ACB8XRB9_ARCLA|nr:hypothetical protein L6452_38665 [Arctium lappa]